MRKRLQCIDEYIVGLGNANWDLSFRCEERLIRALKRLRKSRPRALDRLIAATADRDPLVRFRAVWVLASAPCRHTYPTVLALTRDPDPAVAYDAAMALGQFAYVEAIAPLVDLVRQTPLDSAVDGAAARSLQRMGRRALPALRDLLQVATPAVRSLAVSVLGGIPDPTVIVSLAPLLADEDVGVRVAAVEALGQLGESLQSPDVERCLELLTGCLNDTSDDVTRCARYWIEQVRKKAEAARG